MTRRDWCLLTSLVLSVGLVATASGSELLVMLGHELSPSEPLAVTRVAVEARPIAFQADAVANLDRIVLVVRCLQDSVQFSLFGSNQKQASQWTRSIKNSSKEVVPPSRVKLLATLIADELVKHRSIAARDEGPYRAWIVYIISKQISDLGEPYVWVEESTPTEDSRTRGLPGRVQTDTIPHYGSEPVLIRYDSQLGTISHLVQRELKGGMAVISVPVFSARMIKESSEARKLLKISRQFNGFAWSTPIGLEEPTEEMIISHSEAVARRAIVLKIQESELSNPATKKGKASLRIEGRVASRRVTIVRPMP